MYTLDDEVSDYAIDPPPSMDVTQTDIVVLQDRDELIDQAQDLDLESDIDTLRHSVEALDSSTDENDTRELVTECALIRKALEKKHFHNNLTYITESIATYGNVQTHVENEKDSSIALIGRLEVLRRH